MKIRENDPFFTVDVSFLHIRPSSPAEAAARAGRWAWSRTRKLRQHMEANANATARIRQGADPEPLVPWRELAGSWQRILATFDGLFETADEEEQARLAYHQGGPPCRVFFEALIERKRDRASLAKRNR